MPLLNSMGILKNMAIPTTGTGNGPYYFDVLSYLLASGFTRTNLMTGLLKSDKSSVVVGYVPYYPDESKGEDGIIITTDEYGNLTNQKLIRYSTGSGTYSVLLGKHAIDSSGNIYVVGRFDESSGLAKAFIAKFDSSLNLLWQRQLVPTGAYRSRFYQVIIDEVSPLIYAVGEADASGVKYPIIAAYAPDGTYAGVRRITNSANSSAYGITNNNTIVSIDYVSGSYGIDIIKWDAWFFPPYVDFAQKINTSAAPTQAEIVRQYGGLDNIYVSVLVSNEIHIFKFDYTGTLKWKYKFSGTYHQIAGMTIDSSDNIYILLYNSGSNIAYVVKIAPSGNIVWQRSLNDSDGVHSLIGPGINGLSWKNNNLWIGLLSKVLSPRYSYNWVLPDDGTLTGTYAGFTYLPSSLTLSTSSLTVTAGSDTSSAYTLNDSASPLTIVSSTLTQTVTPL
jgi:hypothetical protein